MSFYVVFEDDNQVEVSYLCGWAWSTIGSILSSRGEVHYFTQDEIKDTYGDTVDFDYFKDEIAYSILTKETIDDLILWKNRMKNCQYWNQLKYDSNLYDTVDGIFSNLYSYIIDDLTNNLERYNNVDNAEDIRKVDLDYVLNLIKKRDEEVSYGKRTFYLIYKILNSDIRYDIKELDIEHTLSLITVIEEVEQYLNKEDKIRIVCG